MELTKNEMKILYYIKEIYMYKSLNEVLEKILAKMRSGEELTPEEKEAQIQAEETKAQNELLNQEIRNTWR